MASTRRDFCVSLAGLVGGGAWLETRTAWGRAAQDPKAWLTYAIDLETFHPRTPLLDRVKLVADAGHRHFEFGRFKAKDFIALAKRAKELELVPVRFTVFQGLTDSKRKPSFLENLADAIEVADLLELKRLVVNAGELIKGMEPERQVDAVLDALEAAGDKLKDTETVLLLDPLVRRGDSKLRLVSSLKAAVDLVAEANTPQVRLLVDLQNGWRLDQAFVSQLRENARSIGGIRLSDTHIKDGLNAAQLDPVELLRLLHDVTESDPVGLEFGTKSKPEETLSLLKTLEVKAKKTVKSSGSPVFSCRL
jgi:hydroxypyruvate isomerase